MWNICFDKGNVPVKNLELIFPTKQNSAIAIVGYLSNFDFVKKVIIFGSSVKCTCNPWSDVDMYIEFDKEIELDIKAVLRGLRKSASEDVLDVWDTIMITPDERLLNEIIETGVVIYE